VTTVVATPEMIVADSAMDTCGNGSVPITKVLRIRGSLWGFSGSPAHALKFLRWVRGGFRQATKPEFESSDNKDAEFEIIQVNPQGQLILWDQDMEPIPCNRPTHGIGSGADFAIGALSAGVPILEAMKIAQDRDQNTREPFQILYLKGKNATPRP
jgi:ATP-dependent protease HslVU (ClpYQ) peptidase subunit